MMIKKHKIFSSILFLFMLFGANVVHAQTEMERLQIKSTYNLEKLNSLKQKFKKRYEEDKVKVIEYLKENSLEKRIYLPNGGVAELMKIDSSGSPIYYRTYNVDAAKSTRVNHLNSGGSLKLNLMGQNMNAYVWDENVSKAAHQEFDGPGGNNRYTAAEINSSPRSDHGTHVTGTIMAYGKVPKAKGMAPHCRVTGYNWDNDVSEAAKEAEDGMLISNHSYGYRSIDDNGKLLLPSYFAGAYIAVSRDWDELLYNTPYYLMVVAAGNDGKFAITTNPLLNGYDKLTGQTTSKNNLVVANANDANVASNGKLNSVTINPESSQGPTDDLRIKPDIAGNGTTVYSPIASSDVAYGTYTGTSMASPNVAGSLLLLQQHYNNLNKSFMRAATLKGLALHTADDVGVAGPDAIWGWGMLNAKTAAETISAKDVSSIISERTINQGATITLTVNSNGKSPLIASISWADIEGTINTGTVNDGTSRLVNDLDIRVSKAGTNFLPWRLTGVNTNGKGDNARDNYERVDISDASGTYTITITHKGNLSGGSQNFSLIVTGITPSPSCTASIPANLTSKNITSNSAEVAWNEVSGATYNVQYRLSSVSSWTTIASNTNSITLNDLSAGSNYQVKVQSLCAGGTSSAYSNAVNFTTLSTPNCTPTTPANLKTDDITSNSAEVTWNEVSGATYNVQYRLSSASSWTTIASNTNSITLDDLSATSSYQVRVQSLCAGGASSFYSNAVNFTTLSISNCTPTIPANLTSDDITSSSAEVTWNAVVDATYNVQYRLSSASSWTTIASNTNSITLDDLSPGSSYQVRVQSLCAGGASSFYSNAVNFTTLSSSNCTPTIPTNIAVSDIATNSARVTWNAVVGATYNVQYSLSGAILWRTIASKTNSITLNDYLSAGSNYQVKVQSVCTDGSVSSYSNVVTFKTLAISDCSTPAPTNLVANNITNKSVRLTWNAVPNVMYRVRLYIENSPSFNAWRTKTNSHSFNGLEPGTTYYIQVGNECSNGRVSSFSNTIRFKTSGTPSNCTLPAPANISANDVKANSVKITWNAVSKAKYYLVDIRNDATGPWVSYYSDVTSRTIGNLSANTDHEYRVRSICINGRISKPSSVFTFKTRTTLFDDIEEPVVTKSPSKITVYPNPTDGKLYFNSPEEIVHVDIYNSVGQKVYSSEEMDQLDLSGFAEGVYVVKVKLIDQSEQTLKVIKKH